LGTAEEEEEEDDDDDDDDDGLGHFDVFFSLCFGASNTG